METPAYQLPVWVEWMKALGIPALAIAVSILSFSVSRWQVKVAKEKLKHDLFEIRYQIYEDLTSFVHKFLLDKGSFLDYDRFYKNKSKILFVFDAEIHNYVDKLLDRLHKSQEVEKGDIAYKYYAEITNKFIPYLQLDDFQPKKLWRRKQREKVLLPEPS